MKIEVLYVTPDLAMLGVKFGAIIKMDLQTAQEWIALGWGRPV